MSAPSPTRRRLRLLLCIGMLVPAAWLLVPILLQHLGIGTATAQARVTAVKTYSYMERSGKNTSAKRTANHATLQFQYNGRPITQEVNLSGSLNTGEAGPQIVFSTMPPHRIVRINGEWQPSRWLFPGVILLLCSIVLWATRNGIKRTKPQPLL